MRAQAPTSRAAWHLLKHRLDRLPNWDRRLKVQRAPQVAYWRAWETSEVARLARELPEIPAAQVAVVIPTFRRAELLRTAVRSVLDQTHDDLVVVIVDDGGGQVEGLPDDPRVHVRRLARNTAVLGVVNNVGIRLTRSEHVALLNDDNTWRPQHLTAAVAALEAGDDIVYTGMCRREPDGTPVDDLAVPFSRAAMTSTAYTDSSTLVVRRFDGMHFSRVPRRKRDFPMEDWEFVWRYSRTRRVSLVPDITVDYLIHEGSYLTDWVRFWDRRSADGQ